MFTEPKAPAQLGQSIEAIATSSMARVRTVPLPRAKRCSSGALSVVGLAGAHLTIPSNTHNLITFGRQQWRSYIYLYSRYGIKLETNYGSDSFQPRRMQVQGHFQGSGHTQSSPAIAFRSGLPAWVLTSFFRMGLEEGLEPYTFQLIQAAKASGKELEIDDIASALSEHDNRHKLSEEKAKVLAAKFGKQDKADQDKEKKKSEKFNKLTCSHCDCKGHLKDKCLRIRPLA